MFFRFYIRESDALLADGCDRDCLVNTFCEIISSESSEMFQCLKRKTLYLQNHPSVIDLTRNKN